MKPTHPTPGMNLPPRKRRRLSRLFLPLCCLAMTAGSLRAQAIWQGGANDATWSTSDNWFWGAGGPGVPAAGTNVVLGAYPDKPLTYLGANANALQLRFVNEDPMSFGTLGEGYTLTLAAGGIRLYAENADIDDDSEPDLDYNTGNVTTNFDLILSATQTWQNDSGNTLTTAGNLQLGNSASAANLTLSGSNDSTFVIGRSGGILVNYGGNRTLTVNDTGADDNLVIESNIYLSESTANRRVTFDTAEGAHVVVNGTVTYGTGGATAGNFTKNGAGTLTFNGEMNYGSSNGTIINAGTVNFNGDVTTPATSNGVFNFNGSSISNFTSNTISVGNWFFNDTSTVNLDTVTGSTGGWNFSAGSNTTVKVTSSTVATTNWNFTGASSNIDLAGGTVINTTGNWTLTTGAANTIAFATNGDEATLNVSGTLNRTANTGGTLNVIVDDPSKLHLKVGGAANNASGFLGGWLTFNGSQWAAKSGDEVTALAGTVQNDKSQWTATDHITVNGATTGSLITPKIYSLILNDPAGGTFAIDNHASALTLSEGALLLGSGVTADTAITGGQLMLQNTAVGAASELIVTNHSASTLRIEANIGSSNYYQSASAVNHLTLTGSGLIELAGTSTYRGNTRIYGNVSLASGSALNGYGLVTLDAAAGKLAIASGVNATLGRIAGGAAGGFGEVNIASGASLTLNQTAASTFSGALTGSGALVKKGSGVLTLNNSTSSYNGQLQVLGGSVTLSGTTATLSSVNSVLIRGGAVTSSQGDAATNHLNNDAAIRLQGTSGVGLYATSATQTTSRTEIVGSLSLEGGASTLTIDHDVASPTGGAATVITFGASSNSITRSNGATMLVRGRNLGLSPGVAGTPASRLTFTNTTAITAALVGTSSTAGATNLRILPYAIGETNTTNVTSLAVVGNSFLTYHATASGGTLGLRALTDAEYASDFAAAAADANLSLNDASTLTGLTGKTINSLRLVNSAGNVGMTGSGNLVLTSGALLMAAGATDNDASISGFSTITSGTAVDELVVFTTSSHAAPSGATLTIESSIVNNGDAVSLTKSGAGTLILTGSNSYSGATTINQGVLQFSSAANLGNTSLIRLAGGTLRWNGNTTDITAGARPIELLGASVYLTPGFDGNILNVGNVFDVGANTVTLANAIGNNGYGGLTKTGSGTLTLSVAPTYTGATVVTQGTMNFQSIAPNTTEALYLIGTSGTVISTVTNGMNVNSLVVGGMFEAPPTTTSQFHGFLTVEGGAVNIGSGNSDEFVLIGYRGSGTGNGSGTLYNNTTGEVNLRNASSVTINVGTIQLGAYHGGNSPVSVSSRGRLFLSHGINQITAGSIFLGYSPVGVTNTGTTGINATISLLELNGDTTIHTDTFVIGGIRSRAEAIIEDGGSFVLRGQQGGDTGANLFIGDADATSGSSNVQGLLDLSGAADVDMKVNLLVLGRAYSTTAGASGAGTLTYDTGLIEATTIFMADRGGVTTSASLTQGIINQSGDAIMRFLHLSKGLGTATWNWQGGTIGNLAGANQTNENVVISLNGSGTATNPGLRTYTVDGNQTSTFEENAAFTGSGSFTKDGEGDLVLKGTNTNTGNVHISQGSVSLSGSGSINDIAWINLAAGAKFDVSARTGGSYTSDAVISGTGIVKATGFTIGSNVGSNNTHGVIRPGSSSTNNSAANAPTVGNQTGTLSFQGDLTLAAGAERAVLQIIGTNYNAGSTLGDHATLELWVNAIPTQHTSFLDGPGGGNYDHISITGQLNVTSTSGITVENAGYTGGFGDVFNLIDWTGLALNSSFTIGERYRTGGETGFDLILPDISSFNLLWDTSLFRNHGILVVVPEPSRALLLLLGLSAFVMRRRKY